MLGADIAPLAVALLARCDAVRGHALKLDGDRGCENFLPNRAQFDRTTMLGAI